MAKTKLLPEQLDAARDAANRKSCIITAPVGWGKVPITVKAFSFMEEKKKYPCLIVTSKGGIEYWRQTLSEAWLPFVIMNKDHRIPGPGITLTNYEQIKNLPSYKLWPTVIFSDAHRLFNRATTTYVMAVSINRTNTIIALNPEHLRSIPSDLFSLLSIVDPNKFGSYPKFMAKYSDERLKEILERYVVPLRMTNPSV